jgi:hypothetical protein
MENMNVLTQRWNSRLAAVASLPVKVRIVLRLKVLGTLAVKRAAA